jgi:anti-sigma factor RsiW
MQMDCETIRDQLDARALGALDAGESLATDAHLAGCAACTLLANEALATAAAIAMAVPLVSADPALKARVMASAAVMSDLPARRSAVTSQWWFAGAAAAIVFGLGALAWGGYLQTQVSGLHDREARVGADATAQSNQFATMHTELVQASAKNVSLSDSQDAVLEIVSQADLKRLPMNGTSAAPSATGRYIWSRTGNLGALVTNNMPPLADGSSYCMWIVYERAWIPGGLFGVDDRGSGRLIVHEVSDGQDHGAFKGFAVTVEPSSSAPLHTGASVLESGLQ